MVGQSLGFTSKKIARTTPVRSSPSAPIIAPHSPPSISIFISGTRVETLLEIGHPMARSISETSTWLCLYFR